MLAVSQGAPGDPGHPGGGGPRRRAGRAGDGYERIALEEIKDAARGQGIADLHEVRLGILEPGGTFSFLRVSDGGARQG
jgi:hypothetical protein